MDPTPDLAHDVRRQRDQTTIVVRGDIDLANANLLRRLLEGEVAAHERVVLDLREVGFIDSLGIGAVVAGYRAARARSGSLTIGRASTRVVAALRLCRLLEVLGPDSAETVPSHDIA